MKKVAVCIGVDNVKNFTPLKGAVLGAKQFAKWASEHTYEVKLFLDEDGKKVSGNDIFSFIRECIESKKFSQLIVYFSGHGISRGPNQEFWLLSDAGSNPNEFINLTTSYDNACYSSIPYVLFISDACRSLPISFSQTMGGQTIFPVNGASHPTTVDVFYATRPGAAALEVTGNNLVESYGIFTECLIDYLNGKFTDTIANYEVNAKKYLSQYYDREKLLADINYKSLPNASEKWIISAVEVDLKLKEIVEDKAFAFKLDQSPEIRVRNHKMEFPLAAFSDKQGKELMIGPHGEGNDYVDKNPPPIIPDLSAPRVDIFSIKKLSKLMWDDRYVKDANKATINKKANRNLFIPASLYSEFPSYLKTGFTVIGATAKEFIIPSGNVKIIGKNQKRSVIDLYNVDNISSGLLILKDGRSIPLPIISGFIGNLIFRDGYLFTINYTPSRHDPFTFQSYLDNEEMLRRKRNFVAIAANNGFNYQKAFDDLEIDPAQNSYNQAGNYLRIGKSFDPSLGLYAAYAFREKGNLDKIKSVYKYMKLDNSRVIFDVAMLAGKLNDDIKTANFCPVMSAGWSYSHLYEGKISKEVLEAATHLEPGLWTTFREQGTEIIKDAILNKKLR